jgi:hypothetical protein
VRACPDHDLWFDGRHVQPQNYAAGATTIYALRRDPIADIGDPFHRVFTAMAGVSPGKWRRVL